MRRLVTYGLAATLLGAAAPAAGAYTGTFANWNFCTANTLSICMDFTIQQDDVTPTLFKLTTTYLNSSVATDGVLTAVGLYNLGSTDPGVSGVAVITPGTWSISKADDLGNDVLFVVEGGTNGVANGVLVGGIVEITFSATNLSNTYAQSWLEARSHLQSVGPRDCSLKPDSYEPGNVVGGTADANARCGGDTVPEPVTLVLLGSGLLGLGGIRMRRRNRK